MILFRLKTPPEGFPAFVIVDTDNMQVAQSIVGQSLKGSGEIDVFRLTLKGKAQGAGVHVSAPSVQAAPVTTQATPASNVHTAKPRPDGKEDLPSLGSIDDDEADLI